jgi:hypothetical protein
MSRFADLILDADKVGLSIDTWSPGDGLTRYRFFPQQDCPDYFGSSGRLYTALGIKEAETWLSGYTSAWYASAWHYWFDNTQGG